MVEVARGIAYRILAMLLYGDFKWITWQPGLRFTVKIEPMRMELVPYCRAKLLDQFTYLQDHGYMQKVRLNKHTITGVLYPPRKDSTAVAHEHE